MIFRVTMILSTLFITVKEYQNVHHHLHNNNFVKSSHPPKWNISRSDFKWANLLMFIF